MRKVLTTIKDAGIVVGVAVLFYALIGLQLATLVGIDQTIKWYKSGGDEIIHGQVDKAVNWFQTLTKTK